MAEIIKYPGGEKELDEAALLRQLRRGLKIEAAVGNPDQLPFAGDDCSAGSENELQTTVCGRADHVDLPLAISSSDFYANLKKRVLAGDMPKSRLQELENYLSAKTGERSWENSWVRFPLAYLSPYSRRLLEHDLLLDKRRPEGPKRPDRQQFLFQAKGENWLRVPVSYLFKLALAEIVSPESGEADDLSRAGERLMAHYLNDNTSPETFSFFLSRDRRDKSIGRVSAEEMNLRYAFTQMLLQFANRVFRLNAYGQQAEVYFAPNPPLRQHQLNQLIPDNFYRELFMSPCLSGWDQGEAKHRYMILCHQVLSRSQLNAMKKLKDAGIITSNLVVLPNTSNISLANNGVHLSLGSRKLSRLAESGVFHPTLEKWAGDLATKIVEHFLPLFVGSYSAAPWRLGFADFHPEKVLGFLPHELDFTHLRMIWRRWKKKADLKVCGRPLTPFGPEWLDRMISRVLGLHGDFVPDQRLLDYLVALLSTEQCPAFNGRPGSSERLLQDLETQGVFDASMSLYLLYKQRFFEQRGFCGFEGRFYSQFHDLAADFADACDLQRLLTVLAYKYIISGDIRHRDIPDRPAYESERRQVFFAAAIGLPTFFVRRDSRNLFLRRIIEVTPKVRASARYPGYHRLHVQHYRRALLKIIRRDGAELIEQLGMEACLQGLEERLDNPAAGAQGRLTAGILKELGGREPMRVAAADFNQAAENYYRLRLKNDHYDQALTVIQDYLAKAPEDFQRAATGLLPDGQTPAEFFARRRDNLLNDRISEAELKNILRLTTMLLDQAGRENVEVNSETIIRPAGLPGQQFFAQAFPQEGTSDGHLYFERN